MATLLVPAILVALALAPGGAAARVESNVVYGMYSGLALLTDVYHPVNSNGYGIIFISGSGWYAPLGYGARPLKDAPQTRVFIERLNEAGYTVFAINHRAAPLFRYPAAVEDAERAVRFVRFHAKRFGIRPDRIGAGGGSSGGHLVNMLGTRDGKGLADDPDPVNRESAKVQCVVALAAPSDLMQLKSEPGTPAVVSFVGLRPSGDKSSVEYRTYREASPVAHVTADDPPFLLIHGDADGTVPFNQSEILLRAFEQAGCTVKLMRIPGGSHAADFGAKNPPDYLGEMVRWFDQHLKKPLN